VVPLESDARQDIDRLLSLAGWAVVDVSKADIHATRGVAIREFPLQAGQGFADYLLYVDGKAAGIVEAKKRGATLTGVEIQSARYAQGLPPSLPAWRRPLPFVYESTGAETHFTNGFDPEPRARNVFAFHRPETVADWLTAPPTTTPVAPANAGAQPSAYKTAAQNAAPYHLDTFLHRVRGMPPLVTEWSDFKLWPAKITAIRNLDASLAQNKPRALIQMATGSGKTFTAISFIYRLIKFAGARRVRLPKTLVLAKSLPRARSGDDNHAEAILTTLREEWCRGNEFAQKITYRTTGSKAEELIKPFRTSYYPRIAVTVDMIATGTDIKPVEIVVFMRSVKSRSFFEQMKGRGVRGSALPLRNRPKSVPLH